MINNKIIIKKLSDIKMSKAELSRRLNMKAANTLKSRLDGTTEWSFSEVWMMTQLFDCELEDLVKK